ncbi:MAG: HEAT repeat domain-containing protein [Myxococcales bacterium]|nr:HEAT repeat domain-containing protein [Myxococcales bacterium]
MKRITLTTALLLISAFVGVASAQTVGGDGTLPIEQLNPAELEQTLTLLSAYHEVPSRDELEAVSPNARQILESIATDTSVFRHHRTRAMAALANWSDARVLAMYESWLDSALASDIPAEFESSHSAAILLAETFPSEAVQPLSEMLENSDLQVRLTAIHVLGLIGSEDALNVLQDALINETNTVAIERMQANLAQLR